MFILKQWSKNLLIWSDEGLNAITGGALDETVSSRLGRLKDDRTKPIRRAIARVICWLLDKIDPGHCDKVEADELDHPHRPESWTGREEES